MWNDNRTTYIENKFKILSKHALMKIKGLARILLLRGKFQNVSGQVILMFFERNNVLFWIFSH